MQEYKDVCDLVWGLLEPWDKNILAHDTELHRLLDLLVIAARKEKPVTDYAERLNDG